MSLSAISSVFQATMGAEFEGVTGTDFCAHCVYALLRVLILSATFLLAHRAMQARNGPARAAKAPSKQWNAYYVHSAQGKRQQARPAGKKPGNAPSDDEDAQSTSAGSSDTESEVFSSEHEEGSNGTRISISDLLQLRPPVGPTAPGSLRTTHFAQSPTLTRAQFDQRRSNNTRGSAVEPQPQQPAKKITKPSKNVAYKQPLEPAKPATKFQKAAPTPLKAAVPVAIDAATVAANSARMAALLEIICADDAPAPQKVTTPSRSRGSASSRQQKASVKAMAFPPGLEAPPGLVAA